MILNYRSLGQGPPVMILHGLFGSLDNWMSMARALSEQFKVYLVDLRNHGSSFHDDQFNYQSMAEDLRQLVGELELGPISMVGHSMGGKAAMFFTDENPQQVSRLIVVDIGPRYYPVHHQQILKGLSAIDIEAVSSRGQADEQLKNYVENQGIRQFLLKNLKRNGSGSFSWKINLPTIREEIDNVGEGLPPGSVIRVPTLFVRGGKSDYITDEDIPKIEQQFPNATIKTIHDAGHWIHAEAPEALLKELTAFIN